MTSVKLYVYDLSNGMARALSQQLTGIQIDGIWHTSIVVFGQETFYGGGGGVERCHPGASHLGHPLEVVDMGQTQIDEGTFEEYIGEMRGHYTADKYHLLEFNCNSFTNDVVGFLTGGSIPSHIKDLPSTFLSTPFGQMMRPRIDEMYRRGPGAAGGFPTAAQTPPSGPSSGGQWNPSMAASLLQNVAAQASAANGGLPPPPPASAQSASLASPLHISTNLASLETLVRRHRATIVLVSTTDSKANEVAFEGVAKSRARTGVAFVKFDADVVGAEGKRIAEKYPSVKLDSTSILLLLGEKLVETLEQPDQASLSKAVGSLLERAFPVHPHSKLSLPGIAALSKDPILYTQSPSSMDVPISKLSSFIDSAELSVPMTSGSSTSSLSSAKKTLTGSFATFLKKRFPASGNGSSSTVPADAWKTMTNTVTETLPLASLFPLVDLWRLAILDAKVSNSIGSDVTSILSSRLIKALESPQPSDAVPKALFLTTLRLLANVYAHPNDRRTSSTPADDGNEMRILVAGLLYEDASVRTAAASLAFNIAASRSKQQQPRAEADDVEMVVAVLEAVERETENEDVVHRLVASLALILYNSPSYATEDSELLGMLQVLEAKEKLNAKLAPGGFGTKGVRKDEVRRLITEVGQLCS